LPATVNLKKKTFRAIKQKSKSAKACCYDANVKAELNKRSASVLAQRTTGSGWRRWNNILWYHKNNPRS